MVNRHSRSMQEGAYKMPRKSPATKARRYVTMARRPTLTSVHVVTKDGELVLETYTLSEALAVRRDCAGELNTVTRDTSPA